MVARGDQDYELVGNVDDMGIGYNAYANRDNYEYGGRAGGADAARGEMWNAYSGALNRGGPRADYTQADSDLARAMSARTKQRGIFDDLSYLRGGGATPQQQLIQSNTANSIGAERSLANSGRGFGAMTMAPRLGNERAAQLQMMGDRQLVVQQAQDMASARDMSSGLLGQMQGQDIATRGALLNRATNDAALEDQQRRQNDEMARFYLGERYRIGQGQLGASIAYEAQDAANRLGYSNLAAQAAERQAQRQEAMENAMVRGGAQGLSFLGSQMGEEKKKAPAQDSYSGGLIRQNPY